MEDPTIIERVELLVWPADRIPQRRVAYFLDAIATSTEGPILKPHSIHFLFDQSEWPLKVTFHGCNGWRDKQKKLKEWVEMIESIHRLYL